jgi:ribonucleoside-diphosphate reductase alpha chain
LQATYTDFYYLRKEWRELAEKENLIGVSMTGIASRAFLSLDMGDGARNVLQENFEFSKKVGITPSYRTTCTKPEGTMSLVLGTSSGVHAWYAPYYWRRVSIAKDEALYQYLQMAHPSLVEDDFFKSSTMAKIKVPQKAPDDAILRDESALETLERVKKVYMGWVVPGHREGINYNNISTTVNIKPDEWLPVREWMWENRDYYTGIAVLPYDGGTYTQSPFEECTKEEYEEALQHLQKVDLSLVFEEDDSTKLQGELACSGGACEIK